MKLSAISRRWLMGVAFIGALATGSWVRAADPIIVVSVKSLNELIADATYLGETVGQPALPALLLGGLNQFTGGQELEGLDPARPIGAFMSLNESGDPDMPVVFVPVKNRKQFAGTLGKIFEKKETKEGITEYALPNGNPLFGIDDGEWYFLSPNPAGLDDLPKPALLVKSKADIAIEIDVEKIPKKFKDQALIGAEQGGRAKEPANEGERIGQEIGIALVKSLITDTARYSISIDIDSQEKFVAIDTSLTARRGTPLAAAFDSYSKVKSAFTDLVTDDTVASFVMAAPVSKEIQQGFSSAFEEGFKEASQKGNNKKDEKEARKVANAMKAAFGEAIDFAIVANNRRGKLQLVGAVGVENGDDLSDLFDELAAKAEDPSLKLNAAEHNEVGIHAVTPKIADPQAKKLFGANSVLNFAIDSDRIVFSFGSQALNGVKAALDVEADEDSEAAPISLSIGLGAALPLFKDDSNAAMIEKAEEILENGNDEIVLEVKPQPRGVTVHFEIQEAVLKLGQLAGGGGQQ